MIEGCRLTPLLTLLMTVDVLWCMTAYGVKSTAQRNRREKKESARLPAWGISSFSEHYLASSDKYHLLTCPDYTCNIAII